MKDEKTLEAIDKIREILREYDLWACLTVVSEERAHWLYSVDPSWSCMSFDPKTGESRIRAKAADFATPEMHRRVVELTTGAVMCSKDLAVQTFTHMDKLKSLLETKFIIKHVPFLDVEYAHEQKKEAS